MKTLNRPMFRYGGPIKEGVMNGIREPKRNGGSMANNEGPRRAALVGNPIYPKGPDGRTGHYVTTLIGLGARGAAAGARYVPKIINKVRGTPKPKINPTPDMTGQLYGGIPNAAANAAKPGFLKSLFLDDPIVKGLTYGYKALTGAGAKSLGQKAVRVALSPSTIAAGIYFSNGKYFNKNDEEVIIDETGNVVDTITTKEEVVQKTPAEIEAAEAAARKKKMDSYREIMDIKGMNKDAAYKSLIDASKIIQEGGNLKEGLKDGSLISKITQAASKRFDKVGDTEAALRSLVAKGEITKEMNKEDKALTNELTRKRIEVADKQLSGDTFLEKVEKFTLSTKGTPPSGAALANLMRTSKIPVSEVADTTEVLNWLGKNKGKDEIDYIVNQVKVGITNGNPLDPGVYVVRDRIVIIDENGNVKPGPI